MVSKKGLAVALSELKGFMKADVSLEQYLTESDLAAELLWHAHMAGDLKEKRVIDLGAGTGILAIGAALLGANVTAVEKDPEAIKVLEENQLLYEGTDEIKIVEGDIRTYHEEGDLVIMNPPFGTKERHADRIFLEQARLLAPVIYTIHKSTTRGFVEEFCKEHGMYIAWEVKRNFPLKKTMAHHRKERERVAVTLYRLQTSP